jgi:hypothetical protein
MGALGGGIRIQHTASPLFELYERFLMPVFCCYRNHAEPLIVH